ncbi:hypothetical protein [Candidatus Pantoea deserta]|uniref:hypothetical protein n=1 Tax=Candidatus Pantoea deserta TaxID=1869313 RepID=UPI0018F2DF63|nr:hypothetical protein [Pantoea deserta]
MLQLRLDGVGGGKMQVNVHRQVRRQLAPVARRRGLITTLSQQHLDVQAQIAVPLPASMQDGRDAFATLNPSAVDVVVCSRAH